MQFSFTSEQEEFRSVLRRFLEEKSPPTVVRRLMETEAGWDRAGWRELNQQLGLTAVHIPEAYGGQGFGYVELGIVLEEIHCARDYRSFSPRIPVARSICSTSRRPTRLRSVSVVPPPRLP